MSYPRHKSLAERENQLIGYLLHGEGIPGGIRFNYMGKLVEHLLTIDDLDTVRSNPEVREYNPLATGQALDDFAQNFAPHLRNRSHDVEDHKHQEDKVRMIARYNDEFAPLVAQIDFEGESELLPGSYSKPRLLEHGGVEYIVRKIKPRVGVEQVEKHIEAGLLVVDVPHMEHIIAISYKDGITVAPKLPGSSFKELERSGNAKNVSESQLREFVVSMKLASE